MKILKENCCTLFAVLILKMIKYIYSYYLYKEHQFITAFIRKLLNLNTDTIQHAEDFHSILKQMLKIKTLLLLTIQRLLKDVKKLIRNYKE